MNNYDAFMWWSINNQMNVEEVIGWFLHRRLPINHLNEKIKMNNTKILFWIQKRLWERKNTIIIE